MRSPAPGCGLFVETRRHRRQVVAQRIRRSGIDDDIRQDHDERVVAHDRTSTQDGVTQAQRLRLTDFMMVTPGGQIDCTSASN